MKSRIEYSIIISNKNYLRVENRFMLKSTKDAIKKIIMATNPQLQHQAERSIGRFKGGIIKRGGLMGNGEPVKEHYETHFVVLDTKLPGKPVVGILTSSKKIPGIRVSDRKVNDSVYCERKSPLLNKPITDNFGNETVTHKPLNIIDSFGQTAPDPIKGGQMLTFPHSLLYVQDDLFEEKEEVTRFLDYNEATLGLKLDSRADYAARSSNYIEKRDNNTENVSQTTIIKATNNNNLDEI